MVDIYVVAAAEAERQRRIKLNDEEIEEEANERFERQGGHVVP